MKKATLNYWVDMITGAALLMCAATGIVRMFPEATSVSSGSATILGVSSALWATVHDWSGVVLASGVALHTALHLRWLVHMTRKVFAGDARGRSHERKPTATGARPAPRPAPGHLVRIVRDHGQRRRDRRVAVDSGACVGCGHCLQTCPQGVFTLNGGKATAADAGSCTLCGRCVQACQPQAITLNG